MADELAGGYRGSPPITFAPSTFDDLFMLIFTSGTSGDPKAVRCTHEKVAVPGVMLAERFGLGPADTCYLSMPLFHSNAVMAGWAVAVAAGASIALRRKFSASQFIPDTRRFNATYANYVGKPMSYILATPTPSRTTPTIRCGSSMATRLHRATSTASQHGSESRWSTASGPPRGGREHRPHPPDTPGARWAHCPKASRSWTSTPASRVRPA